MFDSQRGAEMLATYVQVLRRYINATAAIRSEFRDCYTKPYQSDLFDNKVLEMSDLIAEVASDE